MGFQRHLFAGTALAALMAFSPAAGAQDSGSMQVGGATVSVGAGTAILGLPEVEFGKLRAGLGGPVTSRIKSNDDFIDEYGWNVNGSIAVPMGANKTVSLNGFWANIDDDDTVRCTSVGGAGSRCSFNSIADGAGSDNAAFGGGSTGTIVSDRDVDHWGVSLESKWQLNPGVMGVTRAPQRRYFAVGADVRGIDQKLDLDAALLNGTFIASLNEDLDTRYYGGYIAWGGDYSLPFVGGMTSGLGLRSTFQLRGGVYYADTDYDGVSVLAATRRLSLSRSDTAFIGGLMLETSKQFGQRTTLSLKSEYEYYSYVPDMRYNDVDVSGGQTGPNIGTSIGDDSAFSARTSLRLTIKLGPDSVFEEPLK